MKVSPTVINELICPSCYAPIKYQSKQSLKCSECSNTYKSDSVINLLLDSTNRTKLEEADYDTNAGYNDTTIDRIGQQWLTVFEDAGIHPADKHILEIGAGTGALTVALLRSTKAKRILATDLSESFLRKTLERAKGDPRLSAVVCDCNQMPVQNDRFDVIVGRSILHHLLDYEAVLKQCARVLKDGGKAVFFEPVLEGKLVVAMYGAMIVDLATRDKDADFSVQELNKIESVVRHITKTSWYPQDKESLAKLEDKYIFTLNGMRESGTSAGFSSVEFLRDDRPVDATYWSNFIATMRLINLKSTKFEKYKILCSGYARTFGKYDEFTSAPMGYFCFNK